MRAAPPVSVRAGGSRAWRAVQALLPALAAGAASVWALQTLGGPPGAAAPVAWAAGLLGWLGARGRPVAFAWDASRWTADGVPVAPTVTIDLDGWMLLRLAPDAAARRAAAPPRWLAVTAREAGPAWHALRCALYAAADALPGRALDGRVA